MLLGEAELAGEVLAHVVAVEQGHRPPAQLHQLDHQRLGQGALAGAGEAGEQDGDALAVAGREAPAQLFDDLGEREPLGHVDPLPEPAAELGAGEVHHRLAGLDLVAGDVLAALLDVDHLAERDHRDPQLRRQFTQQLLRGVRRIDRGAVAVGAGTGMIAADDEVGAAVVLADDRVPDGLARSGHPHRQREQAEHRRLLGVELEDVLVAADPGEMVDVPRLGGADHRVDQQVGLGHLRRAVGQLLVRPVHRIAGLEGDDPRPSPLLEQPAQVGRVVAVVLEVVLHGRVDPDQAAAEIDRMGVVDQIVDPGMGRLAGGEHPFRLAPLVGYPDRGDGHCRDQPSLGVAQRDVVADNHAVRPVGTDVEGDRDRPQGAVGEPHLVDDPVVVGLAEEALERRECAVEQQHRVVQLALAEGPGLERYRPPLGLGDPVGRQIENLERAAVGSNRCGHRKTVLACEQAGIESAL